MLLVLLLASPFLIISAGNRDGPTVLNDVGEVAEPEGSNLPVYKGKPGMVAHTPITLALGREGDCGRIIANLRPVWYTWQIPGQPELRSKTLCQNGRR